MKAMKKLFTIAALGLFIVSANAQTNLAPDQNPNYKVSMDKYMDNNATKVAAMNTTIQETYKAYDWREAKQQRVTDRRNLRRDRRMFNSLNNGWNNGWNNGLNNNWNFNYGRGGNRWNNNWNNNWNNGWNNNWNNGWNNGLNFNYGLGFPFNFCW
jgi:hypothetical protein